MTINFPSPATLNQIYSSPPQQWLFDGEKWTALNSQGSLSLYLPLTGGALASPGNLSVGGTLGVTGNTTLQIATAQTPATADNSQAIATTAFVKNQGYATTAAVNAQLGNYLPIAGGTVTGALTVNGVFTTQGTSNLNGAVNTNTITCNGNFNIYGGTFYNGYNNGWLYFNGSLRVNDFYCNNNVNCPGTVYANGVWFQNNGGWFYSGQSIRSGGNLQADGGVVYIAGMYWQNNGGTMYCPWQIHGGGDVVAEGAVYAGGAGGVYFTNYGGWLRSNAGIYTNNLNVNGIVLDNPGNTLRSNGTHYVVGHSCPWGDNSYYCGVAPWGWSWAVVCAYSFAQQSGRSKKTDFDDLPDCLDLVRAVKPQRYRWISGLDQTRQHWGFVAQDVGEAMDRAGHDFGGYRIDRAEDSEGHMGEDNHSLDYNELTAVLWKAVTELAAEVQELKARIA